MSDEIPAPEGRYLDKVLMRLEAARRAWAKANPAPSGLPRRTDIDALLGYNREWWRKVRAGIRRPESGPTLGQVERMCQVMGIDPEEILGRESPLMALRDIAGKARPRVRKRETRLEAAIRFRRASRLPQAAALLVQELESDSNAEAWILASYVLGPSGRLSLAKRAAERGLVAAALEGDTNAHSRSLLALANAFFAGGEYREAEAAYRVILAIRHQLSQIDSFTAHLNYGKTLRMIGRLDEAAEFLRKAAGHAATPQQRSFVWWLLADIEREAGDPPAALNAYETALEIALRHPREVSPVDRAHLLVLASVAAFEAADPDKARRLLPTALTMLSELSVVAPEAAAILAAAHQAAARGERMAAWQEAHRQFNALKERRGQPEQQEAVLARHPG